MMVDGYYTSSLLPGITKKKFLFFFGTYYHQKGETKRKGEHQSRSRAPLYISRCVYTRTEVVVVEGGGEKVRTGGRVGNNRSSLFLLSFYPPLKVHPQTSFYLIASSWVFLIFFNPPPPHLSLLISSKRRGK